MEFDQKIVTNGFMNAYRISNFSERNIFIFKSKNSAMLSGSQLIHNRCIVCLFIFLPGGTFGATMVIVYNIFFSVRYYITTFNKYKKSLSIFSEQQILIKKKLNLFIKEKIIYIKTIKQNKSTLSKFFCRTFFKHTISRKFTPMNKE